ncbi:MAG: hypothetical protein ACLPTB_12455, partial [Acidimicrobiales bacterium]
MFHSVGASSAPWRHFDTMGRRCTLERFCEAQRAAEGLEHWGSSWTPERPDPDVEEGLRRHRESNRLRKAASRARA